MNYPVTDNSMKEFLQNNRQFIYQPETGGTVKLQQLDAKSEDLPEMYTEKIMAELMKKFDWEIVDYYDENTNESGMVYAITINRYVLIFPIVFHCPIFEH